MTYAQIYELIKTAAGQSALDDLVVPGSSALYVSGKDKDTVLDGSGKDKYNLFDLMQHRLRSIESLKKAKDPVIQLLARKLSKTFLEYKNARSAKIDSLLKFPIGHKDRNRVFNLRAEREYELYLTTTWLNYMKSILELSNPGLLFKRPVYPQAMRVADNLLEEDLNNNIEAKGRVRAIKLDLKPYLELEKTDVTRHNYKMTGGLAGGLTGAALGGTGGAFLGYKFPDWVTKSKASKKAKILSALGFGLLGAGAGAAVGGSGGSAIGEYLANRKLTQS